MKRRPFSEVELENLLETQFKIPKEETRAYIRLVESSDLTIEEAASLLRHPGEDVKVLFERMVQRGLIIRSTGEPPRFTPLHPRMTLTNIFKVYEQDVVQGLRDRRATVDRVVNLLTPIYEERKTRRGYDT